MIKCIAIDDEPPALEVLKVFCGKVDTVELKKTFSDVGEALSYLKKYSADLLFLDIQMPDISGIDFYKSLPHNILVIFTTAHSQYAVEGFNVAAVDYLLKPFSFERFKTSIDKAIKILPQSRVEENFLFVRSEYKLLKISYSSIEYIEGLDDYVKIHLDEKRVVLTRMNIKSMVELLPASKFIRVHKSFILPLDRLSSIRNKKILLGDIELPIGPLYEENVMKHFSKE
jgi:DNA-binding LytR/AlgR family response regulator